MVSFKYPAADACGDMYSAATDDRGGPHQGNGDAGQLGHGFDKPPAGTPGGLPEPYEITHSACRCTWARWSRSSAACSSRRSFAARRGLRLGFGEHLYSTIDENFAYEPEKIQLPKKVLEVGCGRGYIVARTEEQDVLLGVVRVGSAGPRLQVRPARRDWCCRASRWQVAAGRYHDGAQHVRHALYLGLRRERAARHGDDDLAAALRLRGAADHGSRHPRRAPHRRGLQQLWQKRRRDALVAGQRAWEYELKVDAAGTCPTGPAPRSSRRL